MMKPAAVSSLRAVSPFAHQTFPFNRRLFSLRVTLVLIMISARVIQAKHVLQRPSCCFLVHRQRQQHRLYLSTSLNVLELAVPTPQDMEDVGAILSMGTGPGDVILLGGDLGAGKTCFSRGFVRAKTGDLDMRVTSPTYLLSNTYDAGDCL